MPWDPDSGNCRWPLYQAACRHVELLLLCRGQYGAYTGSGEFGRVGILNVLCGMRVSDGFSEGEGLMYVLC